MKTFADIKQNDILYCVTYNCVIIPLLVSDVINRGLLHDFRGYNYNNGKPWGWAIPSSKMDQTTTCDAASTLEEAKKVKTKKCYIYNKRIRHISIARKTFLHHGL